jgi:glycosyltransferase involved in cell wall biosynthesis
LQTKPFLLYGVVLILFALFLFSVETLVMLIGFLLSAFGIFRTAGFGEYPAFFLVVTGLLFWFGAALCAMDCFVLLPTKRTRELVIVEPVANEKLTVVLTAFNDELSIGQAVQDFLGHPKVQRVVVTDNNSQDRTAAVALSAGAHVVVEMSPGYGKCVHRALTEASAFTDTDLTLLCEGDMTFRSFDIDKFLAYIPHAQIVNGTRIVEQLRSRHTQLTTFMYYGNFFVGKLLEAKHIGRGTFTDVGTTYKLCRNSALKRLLPILNSDVNLEFNAHFLDVALQSGEAIVECPITFYNRVGVSKGGNTNNLRALKVGLRMIQGLLFSWERPRRLQPDATPKVA